MPVDWGGRHVEHVGRNRTGERQSNRRTLAEPAKPVEPTNHD